MTMTIAQESRRAGRSRWEWAVWLKGTDAELDDVVEVIYMLHPTFRQPIRTTSDRTSSFRLASSGWGEFELRARARRKTDGDLELTHWLSLAEGQTPTLRVGTPTAKSVFLSSTVADAPIAEALREALRAQGLETRASSEMRDEAWSWPESIAQSTRNADALVILVTGRISPWMEEEARLFVKQGKPVLPVLVNGAIPTSPDLLEHKALQVKWDFGSAPNGGDAKMIADRVQEVLSGA
jgi:hypothetical protein